MALTKEQKKAITRELSSTYGHIHLLVDGYKVSIHREMISANRLTSVVYVNGSLEGKHYIGYRDNEKAPEIPDVTKRFWRPMLKPLYNRKEQQGAVKIYGKRRATTLGYLSKWVRYSPEWPSPARMLSHFIKHNEKIEYFPDGFPEEQEV